MSMQMNSTTRGGLRVPTGQRQINQDTMNSIGFNTKTKVEDRAVTRQGLQGIVPKKDQKIERKIQDKSYYVTWLKTKINEISKETFKMNNEIGAINSDLAAYSNLNKTFETLSKEVQNLEGELADYNLAGDKYRSMMKAEDIIDVYNRIRLYNKKKMDESDNLYLENARLSDELQKVEQENNIILQGIEQRLLDWDPEQKNEYEQIREDNQNYIMKIYQLREEMSRLNGDLIEGENWLKNNPNKREAHKLKDSINQLLRKKDEWELQTNESGLSVDELKQRLIVRAKEETLQKAKIDKNIADSKKWIDTFKKSFIELEKEMKGNNQNESSKAIDSITQKDKEYSAFIENYEGIKRNHYKEIKAKEEVVMALLENISDRMNSGSNPLEGTGNGIKDKIKEKKEIIEKSVSTLEEAKAKYEELIVKLQKFETLDVALKKNIKEYKDKLRLINNEISQKYDRIDDQKVFLKNEAERMKQALLVLEQNKENYTNILTSLIKQKRIKDTQWEDNEVYQRWHDLEQKMQANEKNIFSLEAYIESKSNENKFGELLKECMALQQQCNDELLKKYM